MARWSTFTTSPSGKIDRDRHRGGTKPDAIIRGTAIPSLRAFRYLTTGAGCLGLIAWIIALGVTVLVLPRESSWLYYLPGLAIGYLVFNVTMRYLFRQLDFLQGRGYPIPRVLNHRWLGFGRRVSHDSDA